MSAFGHRPGRGAFRAPAAAVRALVTERQAGGVAGTMESPFSPGLALRPDEDWGEWAPRRDRVSSVLPAAAAATGEAGHAGAGRPRPLSGR